MPNQSAYDGLPFLEVSFRRAIFRIINNPDRTILYRERGSPPNAAILADRSKTPGEVRVWAKRMSGKPKTPEFVGSDFKRTQYSSLNHFAKH